MNPVNATAFHPSRQFAGTATEVCAAVRDESPIERRFRELTDNLDHLESVVEGTINRLQPIIVGYPGNPEQANQIPKEVSCEFAQRIDYLGERVRAIRDRLQTAMSNAQI